MSQRPKHSEGTAKAQISLSVSCTLFTVPCKLYSPLCLLLSASILFVTHLSYGQWAATYEGVGSNYDGSIQQTSDGGLHSGW